MEQIRIFKLSKERCSLCKRRYVQELINYKIFTQRLEPDKKIPDEEYGGYWTGYSTSGGKCLDCALYTPRKPIVKKQSIQQLKLF